MLNRIRTDDENSRNVDEPAPKRANSIDCLLHDFFGIVGMDDYSDDNYNTDAEKKNCQKDESHSVERGTSRTPSGSSISVASTGSERSIGSSKGSSRSIATCSKLKVLKDQSKSVEIDTSIENHGPKSDSTGRTLVKKLSTRFSLRRGLSRSKSADVESTSAHLLRGGKKNVSRQLSYQEKKSSFRVRNRSDIDANDVADPVNSVELLLNEYTCIAEASEDSMQADK